MVSDHFMGKIICLSRRIFISLIASTSAGKKYLTRLKLRRRGSFIGCTWFSLVVRPILEKDRFKTILGAPLAAAIITGGAAASLPQTQNALVNWTVGDPLPEAIMAVDLVIPSSETQSTFVMPVPQIIGISQGYHLGHPGVDFRAPLKSPVVAMKSGKVTQTVYEKVGYGQHVYVEHSPFITSLYAHLSTIAVKPGDTVNAGDPIGTIGLTGWSTGPHLHLEIYSEGKSVNPLPLLKPALESLNRSIVIDKAPPASSSGQSQAS